MTLKNLFILITLIFITSQLSAQIVDKEVIDNLIEEIAESNDEELDYTSLYEDLYYFAQNPLNINIATREDLEKFQFLTDFHIEDILEYIRTAGQMQSIYEMQLLESFSTRDIMQILPFITVAQKTTKQLPDFKKAIKYGRNNVFFRTQFILQDQKGYLHDDDVFNSSPDTNLYMGNKLKYYTKYQFDYKRKIKFGFVAEKDPGEQFLKGSQKQGFDYYTAHLQVDDVWKFKTITIGDFQARFGQGLVSWSGMSSGKSSYVMSINKKYDGLRKYSSTDENKFFRGAGVTFRHKDIDITTFFSYKNIDGNISIDTATNEIDFEGSFQTTGMHRTPNEVLDKHSVSELVYGANIKWRQPKFKLGGTFIQYKFSEELNKEGIYNQFRFQGDHGLNASIDYQSNYKNIIFFGEEAISHTGGYALLNSAMLRLAPQMSLGILQRYYTKDYQAYYAAGFGEQSATTTENGMYFGTEMHPIRKWKISAYYDLFKFPWLTYRTDGLSTGADFFTQIDYSYSRYVNMHLKYKQESKLRNNNYEDFTGVVPLVPTLKRQLRYHITYSLSRNLILKNRVAVASFKNGDEDIKTGFMFYQDVNYEFETFPLKLNFRMAFFDAEYDARIYTYENDILYGYSIPGLSGQGIRTYLTLRYTVIKDFIDIWLRYANYSYSDKEGVIGSSLDEIQGDNKSEVKFQIRIKF